MYGILELVKRRVTAVEISAFLSNVPRARFLLDVSKEKKKLENVIFIEFKYIHGSCLL